MSPGIRLGIQDRRNLPWRCWSMMRRPRQWAKTGRRRTLNQRACIPPPVTVPQGSGQFEDTGMATPGAAIDFHFAEGLRERGLVGAYSLLLGAEQRMTAPEEVAGFVDGIVASVRERAVRDLIAADP